jgi:hypothetical protein
MLLYVSIMEATAQTDRERRLELARKAFKDLSRWMEASQGAPELIA